MSGFKLVSEFKPAGDQPQAIDQLCEGIEAGLAHQVLLGVTGSGKTFTMAQVIARLQRSAMVMVHNKTLAAQLYGEFKQFFPESHVEYFVSYYDYYQPEAYVPSSDTYIEKDASINAHIEQMRLSATKALLEYPDTIIVSTVSAIYGLGDPDSYLQMILHVDLGHTLMLHDAVRRLVEMQYVRNDLEFGRGTFRVRGDILDIYPAESESEAVRVYFDEDCIDRIRLFDPLTGSTLRDAPRYTIYPKTHYVTPRERILACVDLVRAELKDRQDFLEREHKLIERQRLSERTQYDIEMMLEMGYCTGIENYSRYLANRGPGEPPPTLFSYLPKNSLLFVDESHVTLGQIGAMFRGDRSRKETLVNYGFRLPSALDNRPLRFEEWEEMAPQIISVSATPGQYELEKAGAVVEQLVRPTGLVDPTIEVRSALNQVDDLLVEIRATVERQERVLVTTLTKKMSQDLTEYLHEQGVRVRYLHSDIETVERVEILRDLRLGVFDVLVGINLLREGLDLPEVSLVAILDADKEGFLRSDRSLIQTIGRAARHLKGRAILYAERITGSMQRTLDETDRRRERQMQYNIVNGIEPKAVQKKVADIMQGARAGGKGDGGASDDAKGRRQKKGQDHFGSLEELLSATGLPEGLTAKEAATYLKKLEDKMHQYAKNLEFEKAAAVRDQIKRVKAHFFM